MQSFIVEEKSLDHQSHFTNPWEPGRESFVAHPREVVYVCQPGPKWAFHQQQIGFGMASWLCNIISFFVISGKDEWSYILFLRSLEALDLSYNQFTAVPMNLPRPLRKLDLQHNSISHIPAHVFRHLKPGLQFLGLSHNALSNEGAERASFVGTYRSLSELLLDNNRLKEVPRSVRQFKNLQALRLDNNQIR